MLLSKTSSVLGVRKAGEAEDMLFEKCGKSSNNADPSTLKELKFLGGLWKPVMSYTYHKAIIFSFLVVATEGKEVLVR